MAQAKIHIIGDGKENDGSDTSAQDDGEARGRSISYRWLEYPELGIA
jgi:hypothetical protein